MYLSLAGAHSVHQLVRAPLSAARRAAARTPASAVAPLKRWMPLSCVASEPAGATAEPPAGTQCACVALPRDGWAAGFISSALSLQRPVLAPDLLLRPRADGPLYDSLDIRIGRVNKVRHSSLRGARAHCVAAARAHARCSRPAPRQAWKHPEAEKLFVEEVDVGEAEPRQVRAAAGARARYPRMRLRQASAHAAPLRRQICSGLVGYVPEEELQVRRCVRASCRALR